MKERLLNIKEHTRARISPWKAALAITAISALIVGTTGCDRSSQKAGQGKKPAITVGKKTFSAKEFENEMERMLSAGSEDAVAYEEEGTVAPDMEGLRKNLVKQLIEERLILHEAEKLGFTITEQEVEEDMNSLWDDPADEEFKAAILEKYSSIDNWKAEIKKQLTIKKIVEELVNSKVSVSAKEARKYYNEHRSSYTIPAQVHARMIVVETKQDARTAKRRLARESFEEVAAEVSTGLEASTGGDLGFFGKGDMPPEFEEVVFKLPPGKLSNIIKTPYGYHIFKVEEKKKGGSQSFADVKGEIVDLLKREKFERAYRRWITTLQKNTNIEVNEDQLLMRETSTDRKEGR
ncbi:hypothetical protein MNBD_DELTA02-200 [hydrothermal vent metagenome]|uniref:peptidylprolyl isomerase n=1 Tax=hydrothermal vent metagenome TaxID=652676 RepID=A0A3B0UUZ7_9ZZZZ